MRSNGCFRILFALLGLALISGCVSAPRRASGNPSTAVECLGSSDASRRIVYLHGADTVKPGELEQANRKNLEALAKDLSVRIALPRAARDCPAETGFLCWGSAFSKTEFEDGAVRIAEAARACFPERSRFGLVGFLNGGYFINRIFASCQLRKLLPKAIWAVSIASAMEYGPLLSSQESLKDCGNLVLMSATEDPAHFDPLHRLLNGLKNKGAEVDEVQFSLGPEVPFAPLRSVLEDLFEKRGDRFQQAIGTP